jgi:hypothetical protein
VVDLADSIRSRRPRLTQSPRAGPSHSPLSKLTSNDGTTRNHAAFIWSIADLLRGDYKQSEHGRVIRSG